MGCLVVRKEIKVNKNIPGAKTTILSSKSFFTIHREKEKEHSVKIGCGTFVQKCLGDPFVNYEILNLLGEGNYGKVYMVKHKDTSMKYAMKIINKDIAVLTIEEEKEILKEIDILKNLDHPNIIKIYEYYNTPKKLYIISELCTGGELFQKIIEINAFSEKVAANIMYQILSAMCFCHSNKITHRDLKPENILIESSEERNNEDFSIKIIDFGTSEVLQNKKMLNEHIGTAYYIAPEVIGLKYNEKCDLWSCGVILYILLCGKPPFRGDNDEDIMQSISRGVYELNDPIWEDISLEAKDLLKGLLTKNPEKRITAEQALKHNWFKIRNKNNSNNSVVSDSLKNVLVNIKKFHNVQKLQQAVLSFLVHNLSAKEDYKSIKKIFKSLDENGDGRLSDKELIAALSRVGTKSEAIIQVEKLMSKMDIDKSGYIEYKEFLIAALNKNQLLSDRNLLSAFNLFDKNKDGKISAKEVKQVLGDANKGVSDKAWVKLVNSVDKNDDGEIDYGEFKDMMMQIVI